MPEHAVTSRGHRVAWALDASIMHEAREIAARELHRSSPVIVVGDRPRPADSGPAAAGGHSSRDCVLTLVTAKPGEIAPAALAAGSSGSFVATLDWGIPGIGARWIHELTGGHELHWYGRHLASSVAFDDVERLVVVHPRWEGMLTMSVCALTDVEHLVVEAEPSLAHVMHAVFQDGPLTAGQRRPIDLALRPRAINRSGVHGQLLAYDGARPDGPAARVLFHIHASTGTGCSVAGRIDGPLDANGFELAVARARRPLIGARIAGRNIERAWMRDAGRDATAPWWSFLEGGEGPGG